MIVGYARLSTADQNLELQRGALPPGEIVHHRNGDRHDNHPDSLEVLPSQRIHMLLHQLERREARGQAALCRDALLRAWRPDQHG